MVCQLRMMSIHGDCSVNIIGFPSDLHVRCDKLFTTGSTVIIPKNRAINFQKPSHAVIEVKPGWNSSRGNACLIQSSMCVQQSCICWSVYSHWTFLPKVHFWLCHSPILVMFNIRKRENWKTTFQWVIVTMSSATIKTVMKVQIDIVFNPSWTAVLLLLRSRDPDKSADRAFLASACKMFGT